jgi:hypothetical protein
MKTKTSGIAILVLVLLASLFLFLYASAGSLQITDIKCNQLNYAVNGEALIILVASGDLPVAGADVYFKLNDETPVYTRTNETGMAVFKPLSLGILKITTEKDEKVKEIELRVIRKETIMQMLVTSDAIRNETLMAYVSANDLPVADADAYFVLNVPVHVRTNATGIAVFKPLVTGTLKITVQKDAFEPASTSIPVLENATFDTWASN